jgi:hypothetical protein
MIFERDIEIHGHHPQCPSSIHVDDVFPCVCRELDEDDYHMACDALNDAVRDSHDIF